MDIFLPYEDVDQYESQTPLHILGETIRGTNVENRYEYGVKFSELSQKQIKGLKYCFEYFRKNSEFKLQAPDSVSFG